MSNQPGVRIVEVGPRDGLQNEAKALSATCRADFIRDLHAAGLKHVEVGSFVSPRWVPQMAETDRVLALLQDLDALHKAVLTPNLRGLEAALAGGADEVAIFGSVSETFTRKNINCSIATSLERFRPLVRKALDANMPVRGYVSCIFECPYEGPKSPEVVLDFARALLDMGCYEVSLGDTIGKGVPSSVQRLLDCLLGALPGQQLAVHFHDTYGMAIANINTALEMGIRTLDAAAGGLGGCPYASGATGNVATEDLVWLLDGLGYSHGIDMARLVRASHKMLNRLGRVSASRVHTALEKEYCNDLVMEAFQTTR
jgi:hydroxymethylglutaryl-CoA lyase